MVAGALEVAVVGRAFLLAVGFTDRAIEVEYQSFVRLWFPNGKADTKQKVSSTMITTEFALLSQLQSAWQQRPAEIPPPATTAVVQPPKQSQPTIMPVGTEPKGPPPCHEHNIPANWQDDPQLDKRGWIRTTCRLCGRVVGYRPEKPNSRR